MRTKTDYQNPTRTQRISRLIGLRPVYRGMKRSSTWLRRIRSGFVQAIFAITTIIPATAQQADPENPGFTVEPIAELKNIDKPELTRRSPDGKHLAFLYQKGSRITVILDGSECGTYSSIGDIPIEGPDKNRQVPRGDGSMVTNYGSPFRPFEFTPDSSKLVFVGTKNSRYHLVVVDINAGSFTESEPFTAIEKFVLLSDTGNRVAAVVEKDGVKGKMVWLDGNLSQPWAGFYGLGEYGSNLIHFLPSRQLLYIGKRESDSPREKRNLIPVIDDVTPGEYFDTVGWLTAYDPGSGLVVGFGDKGAEGRYDWVEWSLAANSIKRTPAGNPIFSVSTNDKGSVNHSSIYQPLAGENDEDLREHFIVHNGHAVPPFKTEENRTRIDRFVISTDGKHYAYVKTSHLIAGGTGNRIERVVVDGKEGFEYSNVTDPIFAPEGARAVYVGETADRRKFVVDGEDEHGPFEKIDQLKFSPNGKLLYIANGGTAYLDHEPTNSYDVIWNETVKNLPDGTGLIYVARKGHQHYMVVGDREFETPEPVLGQPILNQDSGRVAYWAKATGSSRRAGTFLSLFVDGEPFGNFQVERSAAEIFSADGKHVCAIAPLLADPKKFSLYIEGQPVGPRFALSDAPLFLEGGERISFLAPLGELLVRYSVSIDSLLDVKSTKQEEAKQTGAEIVHRFGGGEMGNTPSQFFVFSEDGEIFGTATGGKYDAGAIYRVSPDGSNFEILHHFVDRDSSGRGRSQQLVSGPGGNLFGLQFDKGDSVFKFDPRDSSFEVIGSGRFSRSQLLQGGLFTSSDSLYGIDSKGGMVRIDFESGFTKSLYSADDGRQADVIKIENLKQAQRSIARQTESLENAKERAKARPELQNWVNLGEDKLAEARKKLEEAKAAMEIPVFGLGGDSARAESWGDFWNVTDISDEWLYGASESFVVKIKNDGSSPTVLHEFSGIPNDGKKASGRPIHRPDGFLYGLATGGENDGGILYRIRPDGSGYEIVRHYEKDALERSTVLADGGEAGLLLVRGANGNRIRLARGEESTPEYHLAILVDGDQPYLVGRFVGEKENFLIGPDGKPTAPEAMARRTIDRPSLTERTSLQRGPDGYLYTAIQGNGSSSPGAIIRFTLTKEMFEFRPGN